ncbi:MAG: hypothetical protein Q6361_06840 [Candidatus Hermodarchaeota archaeon]|nr:hypothetical protein [Candidatus Hermodarchaeota archaeon]
MERNTLARILIIIAGILQLFFLVTNSLFSLILMVVVILGAAFSPDDPLLPLATATFLSLGLSIPVGFFLMIFYFVFAGNPGKHRKAVIFVGTLGFLLCGLIPSVLSFLLVGTFWPIEWVGLLVTSFLPGLLVLLSGIIAQSFEA